MSILTVADINTAVNHEPRIEDLKLGFSLGMTNPASTMRKLIGRHEEALKRFGEVVSIAEKTSVKGGRPGTTFWLNLRQALYLATKSEAENAVDLTVEMVDLFASVREGRARQDTPSDTASVTNLAHSGLALMRVGGRTFMVDTRRYKVGPTERAVRIHFDGRISVGKVEYVDHHQNWYGARKAYTPPHKPGPNDPQGAKSIRDLIHVFGSVVEEIATGRQKLQKPKRSSIAASDIKMLSHDAQRQIEMRIAH